MSRHTFRVHEIYDSIQGEGSLAGMPCTFIRLQGCPLRCRYCDTTQALSFQGGEVYSIVEIVDAVRARKRPLTLLTGGEPLAQKGCVELLSVLADHCPVLQLETSGALDISQIDARVRRIMDIKTPGSGEVERNHWANLKELHARDEIKFVITNEADYRWMLETIDQYQLSNLNIPILASPAWGVIDVAMMSQWILRDAAPVRLQLQLHKYIWGAEACGV